MNNCCLHDTDWLSDIIIDDIASNVSFKFNPIDLAGGGGFDPRYSGIWRPIIINNIKYSDEEPIFIPAHINPGQSGLIDRLKQFLGIEKFIQVDITANRPHFKSWTVEDASVEVDIGMSYENCSKYLILKPDPILDNFDDFGALAARYDKINDQKNTVEPTFALNNSIYNIDNNSAIYKIEVVPRGKVFGLKATENILKSMFNVSIGGGQLSWSFSGQLSEFKYLTSSETLILDYTVFTRTPTKTGEYSIRVVIFGTNTGPIVLGDQSGAQISLSDGLPAYFKGSIKIRDDDLSSNVYAVVDDVTIGGSRDGLRSSVDDLKRMLFFDTINILDSTMQEKTVNWFFNSGTENFSYLSEGQSITLNYKIFIYDNMGKYIINFKTITITGKNYAPGAGIYDIKDKNSCICDLNNINSNDLFGTLTTVDMNYNDSISASVISVYIDKSKLGLPSNPYQGLIDMLSVASGGSNKGVGKLNWAFNPDIDFLSYLGGGQILELNYIIEIKDNNNAKNYALISVTVIGKNIALSTSLSNITRQFNLTPISSDGSPTSNVYFDGEFTISDTNTSDLINISIVSYEYQHNNVPLDEIPKNLQVANMLYFETISAKTSFNNMGKFKWIFNSSPQHFRYLNKSNKNIVIKYKALIVDSYGDNKVINFEFTINGYQKTEYSNNNNTTPFYDYVIGWYRYYDYNAPNDKRFIPGVDFYFGDVDVFYSSGIPQIAFDSTLSEDVRIKEFVDFRTIGYPANQHEKDISDNLDSYIMNGYEKTGVLALLKTSPYIDLVTHNLTDIDSFEYSRDDYGRMIPLLSGMSAKSYDNVGKKRFVNTKRDIFYRLANKYGLKIVVEPEKCIKLTSRFKSQTGPNISIQQINRVVRDIESKDFPFLDTTISVGNNNELSYTRHLAKEDSGNDNCDNKIIKLDIDGMKNGPIADFSPCGRGDSLDAPYYGLYIPYSDPEDYYFYIINERLNNTLYYQDYVLYNTSGDYSNKLNYDTQNIPIYYSINHIDFHGHGGIKNHYNLTQYYVGKKCGDTESDYDPVDNKFIEKPKIIFDPYYSLSKENTIDGDPQPITLKYFANKGSKGLINNIHIKYLRSPKKPNCDPFVDDVRISTIPTNLIYDHVNQYYISQHYIPSITNFYLPSGKYYGNYNLTDKNKIGINFQNHPEPDTLLTKTHNLKIINPEYLYKYITCSGIDYPSNTIKLLELEYKGSFIFTYDLSFLPAGRLFFDYVFSSGKATLSLSPEPSQVSTSENFANAENITFLEFDPSIHNKLKIDIDVAEDCDYWAIKLYHEKFDYLYAPLISKIDFDSTIGFFHPNSGWLNDSRHFFRTPFAPYIPANFRSHQKHLEDTNKIRPDHYFWYDAAAMYDSSYLYGVNVMIETTGLSKPLIDIVDKSKYIGFEKNDKNYYLITEDFYKFKYNKDESPIKHSIKMSYFNTDYTYGYPFNDFYFTKLKNNQILVNSNYDISRALAYFDDTSYNQENIVLSSIDSLNIDNQIKSIDIVFDNINKLISITGEQIQQFFKQINDASRLISDRLLLQQEIFRLLQLINKFRLRLDSLNTNIRLLSVNKDKLISLRDNDFITSVIKSSGNNHSLVLDLAAELPTYLSNGGIIKKNKHDEPQSIFLYRSNVTRNDNEITIGKWGQIVAGDDPDNYDDYTHRSAKWHQSALFLNFDNTGRNLIKKYYFPYSYAQNIFETNGSKKYILRPGENISDDHFNVPEFNDDRLISKIHNKLPCSIYAGPYFGQIAITSMPRKQLMYIASGQLNSGLVNAAFSTRPWPVSLPDVSDYGYIQAHNLYEPAVIKITGINNYVSECIDYTKTYLIGNAHYHDFLAKSITCKKTFQENNIFIIQNMNDMFNTMDSFCLGQATIKYNNDQVPYFLANKPQNLPIFFELETKHGNMLPYLSNILLEYPIGDDLLEDNDTMEDRHLSVYDKFLGKKSGDFFTYIDDSLARTTYDFIKTNRYNFYNHNNKIKYNYYTNVANTDSNPIDIPDYMLPSGVIQALAPIDGGVAESVVRSIDIQIDTINYNITIMNSILSDSSKTQIEKNIYLSNINSLNTHLNKLYNTRALVAASINSDNAIKSSENYHLSKIVSTYNRINIPEHIYKQKNQFIDMNIFSKDWRFKALVNNNLPANSGYAYFEGLVEPPTDNFYNNMQNKYSNDKIWIDIPYNAKWGIMTKNGKIFWTNTQYTVHKSLTIQCDSKATICDEQKPENKRACGEALSLDSYEELFEILKLSPELFEVELINIPNDCGKINLCCESFAEDTILETSNIGYYFNGIFSVGSIDYKNCIEHQSERIENCRNFWLDKYIKMECYDHNCPQPSGENFYPSGSLSGRYYGSHTKTIVGSGQITNQSIFMFRIKPDIDFLRQSVSINSNTKLTFINTDINSDMPKRLDNTIVNMPTDNVGFLTIESGRNNPNWIDKQCSYTKEFEDEKIYYFKDINDTNSNFIDIKNNSSGIIWHNEMRYRDFIFHSGSIHPPLWEYDINCYGDNNPFYRAGLSINADMSDNVMHTAPLPTYTGTCKHLENLKRPCFTAGPLYTIKIKDGNYIHNIDVNLVEKENIYCTEYKLKLKDKEYQVLIDHQPTYFHAEVLFGGQSNCSNFNNYLSKSNAKYVYGKGIDFTKFAEGAQKLFSVNDMRAGLGICCSGSGMPQITYFPTGSLPYAYCCQVPTPPDVNYKELKSNFYCTTPCDPEWYYCDSISYTTKKIFGTTSDKQNIVAQPEEGCCILATDNTEINTQILNFTNLRTIEICKDPEFNDSFRHSDHPINYYWYNYNIDIWMLRPLIKSPDIQDIYKCVRYDDNFIPRDNIVYNTKTTLLLKNTISFKINIYHNIIEVILPVFDNYSLIDFYRNSPSVYREKFFINRDSSTSLFPVIECKIHNNNIKIDGLYENIFESQNLSLIDIDSDLSSIYTKTDYPGGDIVLYDNS